jgi:hypothetical protein
VTTDASVHSHPEGKLHRLTKVTNTQGGWYGSTRTKSARSKPRHTSQQQPCWPSRGATVSVSQTWEVCGCGWGGLSHQRPAPRQSTQEQDTFTHTVHLSHLVAPVHSVDVPWRLVRVDLFSLGGSLSLIRHAAQATKPNEPRRRRDETVI